LRAIESRHTGERTTPTVVVRASPGSRGLYE
jgi:hypothetical protein